jgi:hypothetical protein
MDNASETPTIMIVDDTPANLTLLEPGKATAKFSYKGNIHFSAYCISRTISARTR